MSFRVPRRDIEMRFVTKFGENWPLQSCRKVACITTQKNSGSAELVSAPILPKMGQSRPKFPERCHPLTCPRIGYRIWSGSAALCWTYSTKIDLFVIYGSLRVCAFSGLITLTFELLIDYNAKFQLSTAFCFRAKQKKCQCWHRTLEQWDTVKT